MNEPDAVREHRLGVVAVFVENRLDTAPKVNEILSQYGRILVGRMGIPYHGRVQPRFSSAESRSSPPERNLSVIAVIVDGSNDDIGAMTGKLGAIPGVSVKAALRKKGGVETADEVRSEKLEARTQNQDRETAEEAKAQRPKDKAQSEDGKEAG